MIEIPNTLHISLKEFIAWLNRVFSSQPTTKKETVVTNPWAGQHAQRFEQKFFPSSAQSQSQQLGSVATSVKASAKTAVELTAQNAAFAKLAAFFLVIGNALAEAAKTIHEHAKESSAFYNANAQLYAKIGTRMG